MEFTNITLQEGIDRSKQDDHVMFDVREPYRYKQGHLEGALSMPYGVIKDQDAFRDKRSLSTATSADRACSLQGIWLSRDMRSTILWAGFIITAES